jgi:hypothetical protein
MSDNGTISQFHRRQRHREYLTPQYKKDAYLRTKYGISLKQFEYLYNKQVGACAICQSPEKYVNVKTGLVKQLAVDHCHETGKIRGLLCQQCNQMLGMSGDNVARLFSAIMYLENAKQSEDLPRNIQFAMRQWDDIYDAVNGVKRQA